MAKKGKLNHWNLTWLEVHSILLAGPGTEQESRFAFTQIIAHTKFCLCIEITKKSIRNPEKRNQVHLRQTLCKTALRKKIEQNFIQKAPTGNCFFIVELH